MNSESKKDVSGQEKVRKDAEELAAALDGKKQEAVKWTEEFSASGAGKPATIEP